MIEKLLALFFGVLSGHPEVIRSFWGDDMDNPETLDGSYDVSEEEVLNCLDDDFFEMF